MLNKGLDILIDRLSSYALKFIYNTRILHVMINKKYINYYI